MVALSSAPGEGDTLDPLGMSGTQEVEEYKLMSIAVSKMVDVSPQVQPPREPNHVFDKCRRFTRAQEVKEAGLYPYFVPIEDTEATEVRVEGRSLVMLGSNNYLGLTVHPKVVEAAHAALDEFGTSCSGSRFLNGTLRLHEDLEERFADFLGKEAALVLTTGYQTNVALSCLLGRGEIAMMDTSNHASLYDGVRMGFCTLKRFAHTDANDLRRLLDHLDPDRAKMLLTDGVFSMEGDLAPMREYVALAQEYGFPIVLDDAHGLGVLGEHGRGTAEHFGVEDHVEIVTGTFSKAFASIGGVVAGPAHVIDYIKHHGRALIFSASMSPAAVGAAHAALDLVQSEPWRRTQVRDNADYMCRELRGLGFEVGDPQSPVVPIYVGEDTRVFIIWKYLFDAGVYCNPVIAPAVPPNGGMIRTSYMATHTREQLDRALEIFSTVGKKLGLI